MYGTFEDPYCYLGTSILRNLPGLRDSAALQQFEAIATAQRAESHCPTVALALHITGQFIGTCFRTCIRGRVNSEPSQ
jgi:hypothetical protein